MLNVFVFTGSWRIVYQLGHYSTRSTRINSDFGIVSDDLDGTNRGLSGHSFQWYLELPQQLVCAKSGNRDTIITTEPSMKR